jgi:DNA-3-methyladenine glycosylase
MLNRVGHEFFLRDALEIAPQLLGMQLVRQFPDGEQIILDITEVEVYRGEDDLGCHASKGRTARTEVMYLAGGRVYVYLIYGMYWLLNITTGPENHPQAILIRGTRQVAGPGRVGKALHLDKTFYGENLTTSTRLWIEANDQQKGDVITLPRVGIDYAGPIWANAPWRFVMRV